MGCTGALEAERNSIITSISSDVCQQDKKDAISRAEIPRCYESQMFSYCRFKEKKKKKKLRLELHLQVFPCEAREKGQNAKRQRDGRRKKKKGEKKHDKTLS